MKIFLILTCIAVFFSFSFVHDEKKDTVSGNNTVQTDSNLENNEAPSGNDSGVTARLSDFPTLHPLIVHFAIGFILIAALIQITNLFLLKREISWMILVILLIGLVAAYLASSSFHPHAHGISNHARLVLEQHDEWAERTIFSASVAFFIQLIYLFYIEIRYKTGNRKINPKSNRIFMLIIALIMSFSAYSVLNAGHYGAQLVHIEGIGPQGKYLETEDED